MYRISGRLSHMQPAELCEIHVMSSSHCRFMYFFIYSCLPYSPFHSYLIYLFFSFFLCSFNSFSLSTFFLRFLFYFFIYSFPSILSFLFPESCIQSVFHPVFLPFFLLYQISCSLRSSYFLLSYIVSAYIYLFI
jgi:hypothetical protein